MQIAGVGDIVDAYDIGFNLGPRLTAAGRLGDALNALQLLTTDNISLATELARHLHEENTRRQEVEKQRSVRGLVRQGHQLAFLARLDVLVYSHQVRRLAAQSGTVINDLYLDFFGCLIN